MNKKTITICASASCFKEALDVADKLEEMGFKVLVPKVAKMMKKNNNFDVIFYQTWFKNNSDYKKKALYIREHFKEVIKSDAILVTNFDKKGIKGYIGGNSLMEMALAFHYKKPIFILKDISDKLPIMEEVYALNPKFINGDLEKIKLFRN